MLKLPHLAPSTTYSNPPISALSNALKTAIEAQESSHVSDVEKPQISVQRTLNLRRAAIGKIAGSISLNPTTLDNGNSAQTPQKVFILTGSTGSVGSYLLHSLLRNPGIAHVHCLNRSRDSAALQKFRNETRQLEFKLDPAKVSFLHADLAQTHLGIPDSAYQKLLETPTHVIHDAWPVTFNLSLDSFKPSLAGLDSLAQFVASACQHPWLLFISSISATINLPQEIVPEKLVYSVPQTPGYGASKYIAEHVLDYASGQLNISVGIARVGQVAGPVNSAGPWNKREWFPSLVISSATVGAIPDSLGQLPIDWVPVDILADVIQELALAVPQEKHTSHLFQPVNTHIVSWSSLLPSIVESLEAQMQKPLQVCTLREWIELVRAEAEKTRGTDKKGEVEVEDIARMLLRNPAAKLLEWFEELLALGEKGKTKKW